VRAISASRLAKQDEDVLRHGREIANYGCEVLAIQRASFIERYIQLKSNLAIRLVGRRGQNPGFVIEADLAGDIGLGQPRIELHPARNHEDIEQSSVFPGQIKGMQGEEQVIPSRIRQQTFDDPLIASGDPLYLFESWIQLPTGRGQEGGMVFPDGKIGTFRIREAIARSQGARQQIQTTSDAVNYRPSLRVNDGIERLDITQAVNLFSGLTIGINSDGIGFVTHPAIDTFFQNWELGYGPVDCGIGVI
jgi:hypothetical protein